MPKYIWLYPPLRMVVWGLMIVAMYPLSIPRFAIALLFSTALCYLDVNVGRYDDHLSRKVFDKR